MIRFTLDDLKPVLALYRRVFGPDAAEANRLRWEWQYRAQPLPPSRRPADVDSPRGPDRRRPVRHHARPLVGEGSGDPGSRGAWTSWSRPNASARAWAKCCSARGISMSGAALGLGLSESSYRLFQKMRWPNVGPVPVLVKPLTRRALRQPNWPMWVNRLVSAVTLPVVRVIARARPLRAEVGGGPAVRRRVHRPVGPARAEVRLRRAARRAVPQLEVLRSAARPLSARRAAPRHRTARLRRVPPPPRTARQGDAAGGLPGRSGRRTPA